MIYIKKILNLIIKKGKKSIAQKNVNSSLETVRPILKLNNLVTVFENIVPLVYIKKKKVAGKVYQIPTPIKEQRAVFQTARWVMTAIESEKKKKTIAEKLAKQLILISRKKGTAISLRNQFLAVIKENRSYMRFIRRRFKKKKKWVFNHGFSTKLIKMNYNKNLWLQKKNVNKKLRIRLRKIRKKYKDNKKKINESNNSKKVNNKNKKLRGKI